MRQHSMNRTVSPPTPAASPGLDDQPSFPPLDQHAEDKWPRHPSGSSSRHHPELPATPPQPFNPHLFIHDSVSNFALLQPHERRRFLEAILPVLSNADRLHLSTLLTPMLKRDFLKDLPQELGLHILSYLEDPKDLVHASTVSNAWRRLVLDEATWKQLFEKHRFGGGSKPSLGLSAKPSRHPGVLPLAQSAPPAASSRDAAGPRSALPRSRLPSQQTPEWADLSADVDARALRGLGLRRQSVQQSPTTTTAQAPPPAASTSRLPQQQTNQQNGLPEAQMDPTWNQHSIPPTSARPSFSLGRGLSQMRLQEQQQQQPQEDVLSMAAPSRPRMPPQITSNMGSDVSGTSSQLPPISDPLNPVELGAAAARIEVPTLSQSTEDETPTSLSPAAGGTAATPTRPSMRAPSTSASALARPASSQETHSPLRRGISNNNRAYSQTDMLSFASVPPQSSASTSSGPVYSPRALAASPESSSPALPFQTNPFSQPQIFPPPPRSASTSNVPSMAASGKSEASASASEAASSAARRQFSYQSEFKRAYLTESNWLRGPGRVLSSQAAGEEGIVTCLCFDNDYIIVGMAKKEIHVFDARSGHYVRTLRGHLQGVWAIALVSKGSARASSPTESESVRPTPAAQASSTASQQNVPTFDTESLAEATRSAVPPPASFASQQTDTSTSAGAGARPRMHRRPSSYGSARDFVNSGSFTSPSSSSSNNDPALGSVCGTSAGWGQKGALAVSGSCDRTIRVWDVETG